MVHNYFPAPKIPFVLNIASTDEKKIVQTKTFAKRAIDLSFRLGAPFYSLHAGFAASLQPNFLGQARKWSEISVNDREIDKSYQVMIETTQEISDYAKDKKMSLLIENNVLSPLGIKRESIKSYIAKSLLNHFMFHK